MDTNLQIDYKSNLLLVLLCGRSLGFATPVLNNNLTLMAGSTPDIEAVRNILRTNITSTDAYALGALAAAMSCAPSMLPVEEFRLAFRAGLVRLPALGVTGAELAPISARLRPSMLTDLPATGEPRLNATLQLTIVDTVPTEVLVDGLAVEFDFTSRVLRVQDLPPLYCATIPWAVDGAYTIQIQLAPRRYPYLAIADKLSASHDVLFLLNRTGMLPLFHAASTPFDKVGAAALGVIKATAALAARIDLEVLDAGEPIMPEGLWLYDELLVMYENQTLFS